MQVHVAQHDADRTALWGSLLVWIDLAVFQDGCLQPAPDQADHARIADAVLHEAEHPFVTERLTENELSDFSPLWHDDCVKQSSRHKMWTEITRRKYERGGQRYASDLTDGEWALIEPHMPAAKPLGRPREIELRAVLDAILY